MPVKTLNQPIPLKDQRRFLKLVKKVINKHKDAHACWEFPGSRNKQGYGTFYLSRVRKHGRWYYRQVKAHRMYYEIKKGPIPDGKLILHKCDNPPCFRDSHLKPGTQRNNMDDMCFRGRQKRKINDYDKYEMQILYWSTHITLERLARKFNIGYKRTYEIVSNIKQWRKQQLMRRGKRPSDWNGRVSWAKKLIACGLG